MAADSSSLATILQLPVLIAERLTRRTMAMQRCLAGILAVLLVLAMSGTNASQSPFTLSEADAEEVAGTSHPFRPGASPSPDTFRRVHLSRSGLYLGSPLARNAPPFVSLHVDAPLYFVDDVKIRVGRRKVRSWEQVHLECGPPEGGRIEACEEDDLKEAEARTERATDECKVDQVIPSEARVLISAKSCPPLASILRQESVKGETYSSSALESITLTFDVQRLLPVRRERHHFWLARLHRASDTSPDGGALWPFAGTAHGSSDSTKVKYTGLTANRIDSLMQDPYIARAATPTSSDPLNGVDLTFASWANGISIRVPSNGNESLPTDIPFEPVHAPVAGQIVWKGKYSIARAPGNHRNDENGIGIMIRDEWGMVYQLLGLHEQAMRVHLGETVEAGQHIGGASRTPLSLEPPCRHKPADPPKMDDDSRRYPFRFRLLRILVARPDPSWTEWQEPFTTGWQYFNPLDAFTLAGRSNGISPNPSPSQIFFAEPGVDGALQQPRIIATSNDLIQPPTLAGDVEIIVGFDTFMDTPGDAGDQVASIALHAIDYAIYPLQSQSSIASNRSASASSADLDQQDVFTCDQVPKDLIWRTAFEHAKLPNAWSLALPKTNLLAHYVPAFTVGSVPLFKTPYASQFDDKGRKLFYSPTRILAGQIDSRGYWDTRREPRGNGLYQVWVRGRDWFGKYGCIGANVRIRNGP